MQSLRESIGQYRTILADPPWMEKGGGKVKRGADRHYPLMATSDICALGSGVNCLAHQLGAHLYLWVTNNFLADGLRVMEAWGFEYITMITWAKDRQGLGQYFRGQTEHILFGRRGKVGYKYEETDDSKRKRCQGSTLITAPRKKHSQKPPEARTMIEHVSRGPYLELFARERSPGWHIWGNELDNDVDLLELSRSGAFGQLFACSP